MNLAAFRSLFTKPSYLIVSVAVLAVSIAVQLDLTAIVDAMLLRPPSGRHAEEFAYIRSSEKRGIVSYPDYVDIAQRNTFFSETFGYASWLRAGVVHGQTSAAVACGVATGNFFPSLGLQPALGRVLAPSDDLKGADPVVMVSASLADKLRLEPGSPILVDGAPFTVVGILPLNFQGIDRDSPAPDVWMACAKAPILDRHKDGLIHDRNLQWIRVAGRLKPGIAPSAARAELAVIAGQLQKENPVINAGMELHLDSFTQFQFFENDSARSMLLVSCVVWFLFGLAFANFFSLTLLRIFRRRRELAIQMAIGASRRHIGAWLLGELAVVSMLSVALGYGLGRLFLRILLLDPSVAQLASSAHFAIDWRPLRIVIILVALAGGAVWLLAVRAAWRTDLQSAIKETASAPQRRRLISALYALQFALALFLLSMATSFGSALHAVAVRQLPFRTENLLLLDVNFRSMGVVGPESQKMLDAMLTATRQTPGVIAVGGASVPLLTTGGWTNLIIDGRDPALDADKDFCRWNTVTPDFWKAAGIPLLEGRLLTDADLRQGGHVGVLNAAAARRFWPGRDAVGRQFKPYPSSPPVTVIGVVADIPQSRSSQIDPLYYRPTQDGGIDRTTLHIAVQADSPEMRLALRRALAPYWPDPDLPPFRSIRNQIELASADLVTAVRLVLWVAAFATLVTGCGLYFFSAYTASQNLKDAAIRMALGATHGDIVRSHLGRYRSAILAGFVLYGGLLVGAQPLIRQLDVGISSPGPIIVFVAAVPLAAIALIGLCAPLVGIRRLNLYRMLVLSE